MRKRDTLTIRGLLGNLVSGSGFGNVVFVCEPHHGNAVKRAACSLFRGIFWGSCALSLVGACCVERSSS